MIFFRSSAININQAVFLFSFLIFSSRGQDDCFGCWVGNGIVNGLWFTGEQAINGIGFLKGAFDEWHVNPAAAQDITDPVQAFVGAPPVDEPDLKPAGDPRIAPGTETLSENSDRTVPDIQLLVTTPAVIPPPFSGDDKCDPKNLGGTLKPDYCSVAIAQIVWPPRCANPAEIARILAALNELAPPGGVRTFWNECGTSFWTAALTQEQVEKLLAANIGIQHIVIDGLGEVNSFSSRVQRRVPGWGGPVTVDDQASPNLAYYSTAPELINSNSYVHFKNVGKGMTAYLLDVDLVPANEEIVFAINKLIFAEDVANLDAVFPNDSPLRDHGGCLLSIIGGAKFGVARKANLVHVQTKLKESSFLSGLQQIINDLAERERKGKKVKGRTVIGTSISYGRRPDRINETKVAELINRLIDDFQVVFVSAAGNNMETAYAEVDQWPPTMVKDHGLPLIIVGAIDMVNGKIFPWSKGGSGSITITAPGDCYCKKFGGVYTGFGTSQASAMVVGAALDFLSRGYVRDFLNLKENEAGNPSVSAQVKVRDYLASKAYARPGGGGRRCIWNGLFLDDLKRMDP